MIKLEKIILILAFIGLIIKFTLLPMSSTLFALSVSFLSLLYWPMGFALLNRIGFRQIFKKDSYQGLSSLRIIGSIGTGMALSALCLGILFKLLNFPGGNSILIIGLVTVFTAVIPVLIKLMKTKEEFYAGLMKRIVVFGCMGIVALCLSVLAITKIRYHNYPEYIKAYELYLQNPQDMANTKKLDMEYKRATMSKIEFEDYQSILKKTEKHHKGQ